ncbi:SIR2-domain-containing protein [Tilletiopsis washingtonensis]|uniref:SIR2-domain-containing protein n=1 Tax=Tilletiopsis washingtonensis TaxID=58919 RepID=A0A316ZAW7_9BASI|nr:SIR2-domain-containing protein [Tilletiopsis washingtonensis]PWN97343.1 SIR2-domain-containing protein [Tilletiopsis washingtonensis]
MAEHAASSSAAAVEAAAGALCSAPGADLRPGAAPVRPLQPASIASSSAQAALDAPMMPGDGPHDCDSSGLELLENAAEEECEEEGDDEAAAFYEQACVLYPDEQLEEMLYTLRERGFLHFIRTYVRPDVSVRAIQLLLVRLGSLLPRNVREDAERPLVLGVLRAVLMRILRRREKLPQYNSVDDAVALLRRSRRIVVLSGAGISVSCGIPDFRSKDGIYATLMREGKYDLADPQEMFDKEYFMSDPACFFSFAHRIFPSNFTPSPTHRFIKLLEERDVLLRDYTQNIDTLEQQAGITRVLNCHGSFAEASCTNPLCGYSVAGSAIKEDIFAQRVPYCPRCHAPAPPKAKAKAKGKSKGGWNDNDSDSDEAERDARPAGWGVLKPDIVFFGEKLSDKFDRCLFEDRESVDLVIIVGTALKVAPVSELIGHMPHSVPVLLINRTPVLHIQSDIQLLGDADVIVQYLCQRLGWTLPAAPTGTVASASQSNVDIARLDIEPQESVR